MKLIKRITATIFSLLLVSIFAITPALATAQPPVIAPNGDSIIAENDEKFFLPKQGDAIAESIAPEPAPDFVPYGLFDKELRNVRTYEMNLYHPLTAPLRNDYIVDPVPHVSVSASAGVTVSASFNANVEVDAQIVRGGVGYEVGGSLNITAGQEYSFPVPYGQQGTIVMRYSQYYSTYDVYSWLGSYQGNGSSWSKPYSYYVTLQRIYLW